MVVAVVVVIVVAVAVAGCSDVVGGGIWGRNSGGR